MSAADNAGSARPTDLGAGAIAADTLTRGAMPGLLDKRLIFVTGKGGVGKSTVAIALGLLAARAGQRTIVAEVASQDRIPEAFARSGAGFAEVELAPGLFTISIDPQHAMEEYLRVKAGTVGDVLGASRVFQYLAAATPGMRELLTIGKVWELAQLDRRTPGAGRYDLVIVDAPASGHGVGIMRTPKTFADIARLGPIAHQGRAIHATISDPGQTGVLAVARPEEMAVTETLELGDALHDELGLDLDLVVVNALYPERVGPRQARALARALHADEHAGTPLARAALRTTLAEHARARGQREQLARLAEGTGHAPVVLPFLFAAALDRAAVESLAGALEGGL